MSGRRTCPKCGASYHIEYKRPDVEISQKVFDQISRYNITMRVDLLIVSNGLEHYCCRINYEEQNYEFLQEIPSYQELIAPRSWLKHHKLSRKYEKERNSFHCHRRNEYC